MSEDDPKKEVFALLNDEYARAILTETSIQPMSASELSEECNASLPTIYRRIDRLVNCGLLAERTEIAEDGHHYSIYEARLKRLSIELSNGQFQFTIEEQPPEDMADRFTRLWEGI